MKRQRRLLGDLCELTKGRSPITKTPPGPFTLVTTGEEHKTADSYQFDCEAVCIPLISSTGHGHASLKRVHYQQGKFALANLLVAALIKDPSSLSTKFLAKYLMFTKDRFIVPLMTGVANMSISIDRLATVPIDFPPLSEQERIVKVLDEADELRKMRAEADKRTATLIPALFHQMFGDPATNPKGWPMGVLAEHIDLLTGFAFKSEEYVDSIDAVRLCRGANVLPQRIDWSDVRYWPLKGLDDIRHYVLTDGDIVLAMDRPWISDGLKVARLTANDLPSLLVQRVARIRPRGSLLADFIYHSLCHCSFAAHCSMLKTETTVPHISPHNIRSYKVHTPPLPLQQAFAQRVAEIREMEAAQRSSHTGLDSLFQSLLHRAFNGE